MPPVIKAFAEPAVIAIEVLPIIATVIATVIATIIRAVVTAVLTLIVTVMTVPNVNAAITIAVRADGQIGSAPSRTETWPSVPRLRGGSSSGGKQAHQNQRVHFHRTTSSEDALTLQRLR